MKQEVRNNIEIILVEPAEPGNIGAAARAMNNMGFVHLGLVKPVPFKVSDAYKFAWNSQDIIDNAKEYKDIPEAVKDKGFVVAMSRRSSKDRGHLEVISDFVSEIHRMALKTKVGILFGCESYGLTNEDLLYANRIVKIHTASRFSSLNLAQAVLITCHEMLGSEGMVPDEVPEPAKSDELEMCYEHIERVLYKIGYGTKGDRFLPQNIIRNLRRLAGRAVLDGYELQMVRGLCTQVEKALEGLTPKPVKNEQENLLT